MNVNRTHRIGILSALALGLSLAGEGQAATFIAGASAASRTQHTEGPNDIKTVNGGAGVSTASASGTDRLAEEGAQAASASSATAGIGAVHVYSTAVAAASGCCASARGSSNAFASYTDSFVLGSSTVPVGSFAVLTFDILFNGTAGGGGSGAAWAGMSSWGGRTTANGTVYEKSFERSATGVLGVTTTGDDFGLYAFTTNVVFGQAVSIQLLAYTDAIAQVGAGNNSAQFTADLGHTVSWEGIRSLTVGGVEVTDFTAVSRDTGFDFASGYGAGGVTGVPEPSTWAMLVLGFAGFGAALRRRRLSIPAITSGAPH